MNNENRELTEKKQTEMITSEKVISYLKSFGLSNTLKDNEITQFVEVAVAFQLNPFKREIYCIPYETKNGRKLSIITGYEVYLKRAERTGKLAGWEVTTNGDIKNKGLTAVVTIYRKDWDKPLVHEVEFSEYNQGNSMWMNKPKTMLKKVAIAQGFRMAFPDEFSGMPYTADELPDNMVDIDKSKIINVNADDIKAPQTNEEKENKQEDKKEKQEIKRPEQENELKEIIGVPDEFLSLKQGKKTRALKINDDFFLVNVKDEGLVSNCESAVGYPCKITYRTELYKDNEYHYVVNIEPAE
jgi:phage recombination protein Bet